MGFSVLAPKLYSPRQILLCVCSVKFVIVDLGVIDGMHCFLWAVPDYGVVCTTFCLSSLLPFVFGSATTIA